jgi:single-strand DNA-binding protein
VFRNHFSVLGNAGAEPTLRRTLTGGVVATINVATNYRHKDADGRWLEATEWHRITAFDRLAKELQDSVKKGTRISVEGYMRTRKFIDTNHQDRYAHELVATQMWLGPAVDNLDRTCAPANSAAAAAAEEDITVI